MLMTLGAANTALAQDKRGGDIIFGETSSIRRFNPYHLNALKGEAVRLFSLVYEGLVRYDYYEEEFYSKLAESWEYDEASKTITFTLRRNVKWHDGRPFTAKDVAFTYRFIASARTPAVIRTQFSSVRNVTAVDDFTVTAQLTKSVSNPLHFFKAWIIPAHRFKDDLLDADDGEPLSIRPVGTGPYSFMTQTLEGHIRLRAFEDYWGELANILDITRNRVTDPQSIITGAVAVDAYQLIRNLHPNDFGQVSATNRFITHTYPSLSIHAVAHNNDHHLLRDKAIRQAITIAVNRQGLLDQWYGGKGAVISGPYNHQIPYSPSDVRPFEFNPGLAETLLESNNYIDRDNDGIRESANGDPLSFNMLVTVEQVARETINQQMAASIASELKQIGIEVNTTQLSSEEWRRRVFELSDYEMALVEWAFDPIYDISDMFSSRYVEGNNIVRYRNADVDMLIDQLGNVQDAEQRRQTAYELQRILREDCPYTFLFSVDKHAAIHRRVHSARISPFYFYSYFPSWYIPADLR